jgi:hypothetical protein
VPVRRDSRNECASDPSGSGSDLSARQSDRDLPVGEGPDVAGAQRGGASQRLGVEQQQQAGEAVARVDVAVVQQATHDGEPLLVVERRWVGTARVPGDVEFVADPGARQPAQEHSHAAAGARAGGDPRVDEVLAQVAKLELLSCSHGTSLIAC